MFAGGYFIIDIFNGYLYYVGITVLAGIVVSLDYLLSKNKTWKEELKLFMVIVVISFFFGFIADFIGGL